MNSRRRIDQESGDPLEQGLYSLGRGLEHVPTPDVAAEVRKRVLEQRLAPPRSEQWTFVRSPWRMAVAVGTLIVVLGASLALMPTSREALARFFGPGPTPPPTATPDPHRQPAIPRPSYLLPTISPPERESASDTWLYLTAFQNGFVSVIDPVSGHVFQQIRVDADQAGIAVSPDGRRLYVADGRVDSQLRVFDTATWQVIHHEPLLHWAHARGGNPIALSPDGRWLALPFYDSQSEKAWHQLFDTERLEFLSRDPLESDTCPGAASGVFGLAEGLVGRPDGAEVYVQCDGFVAVLSAKDLSVLRTIPSAAPFEQPGAGRPALAVSPDGNRLLGLYPIDLGANLLLYAWGTETREDPDVVRLNDQVSVPLVTLGHTSAGYLTASQDGQRLFVAWEDMLWSLDAERLQVMQELRLTAPVDGMVQSMDGRELYLLPSTAGDLTVRERGMFTVDADTLQLVRHASDWPSLNLPFFFAAPSR